MTEDGFPDDMLTFLVLSDVTLFGNSEQLKEFDQNSVHLTRDRLLGEGYANIITSGKPLRGDDVEVRPAPRRGQLTNKGRDLFIRLKRKLRI